MAWDDEEEDAFFATVDWEAQVQQARARQHSGAMAAQNPPLAAPAIAVQHLQRPAGPPQHILPPAAHGLRSLFTNAAVDPAGAYVAQGHGSVARQGPPPCSMQPTGQHLSAMQGQQLPQQPAPAQHPQYHPQQQWQSPLRAGQRQQPQLQQAQEQIPDIAAPLCQQPHMARSIGQGVSTFPPAQPGWTHGPDGQQQPPGYGKQQQQQRAPYQHQAVDHEKPAAGQHPPSFPQQQQQQQHPSCGSISMGHNAAGSGHAPAMASSGQGRGPLVFVNLELCKPELGREHMIEVVCGYNETLSAALKRIPGGVWDARSRHWKFPVPQHGRIMQVLQGMTSMRVKLEPLHEVVSAVLQATSGNPDDSSRYCHIPANLEQQLMPFQREGIKFALRHGGRALIGDEMGLGKTVQAIAVASAYRDEWPVLIIAPSSLREAWADALHRWLGITEDKMHIVHTNKDASKVPKDIQFLIISYNFVQKMNLAQQFRVVILDESHFIKDGKAQRTKATVPLVKDARRALLLSGTPALNKPKEIFQQLAALVPAARLKMKDFGERYCLGTQFDKFGGATNLAELNAMLKNSVMVRRLKRDVLTQLPSKRRQQVMLGLDVDAKNMLSGLQRQLEVARQVVSDEAKKSMASGSAAGGGSARMEEHKVITELYCKSAVAKAKAVQEYVQLLLDSGQKFLVFAHHSSLMDAIEHTCNRHKGCKFIRIDGKTPPSQRQSLVNNFQDNEDMKVAILSIRAAGTGLTLTAASTVVFAEMTWTPGEIIQAEDRAHRIGQASSVNVYFLHAKGSVDDLIWQSIQNKLDAVGEAIDGQAQALDARRTEAPDRGQMMLNSYLTQSRAEPSRTTQQQQQQPEGAADAATVAASEKLCSSGPPGSSNNAWRSPGKTQQASLLNYFSGRPCQKQQQQQQPPVQQAPGQPLQAGDMRPGPHFQQQQQQQQALPGGCQQRAPPGSCQQQHAPCLQPRQQQLAENAGGQQPWQPPIAAGPMHAPSGMENMHPLAVKAEVMLPDDQQPNETLPSQHPMQQQLAGMKRPYEGS